MTMKLSLVLASVAILCAASITSAQTSSAYSGTQVNGLFGSNTVGGTSPSQGLGGSSSAGGVNTATGTVAPNVATSNQNVALSAIENTRKQTQGAFVGADTADTGNFLSRQATAGTSGATGRNGGMNGLSQLQSLFSQSQQGMNGGQNQSQSMPQIRIALRLGFRPQPVSTMQMQAFQTRLTRLPGMRFVGAPDVVMEGRTAVLRGKVASEEDRELAEALAKMEPDVLKVRNELEVIESSPSDETLPAVPGSSR